MSLILGSSLRESEHHHIGSYLCDAFTLAIAFVISWWVGALALIVPRFVTVVTLYFIHVPLCKCHPIFITCSGGAIEILSLQNVICIMQCGWVVIIPIQETVSEVLGILTEKYP